MKKTGVELTTYSKVILSGWPAIFDIISKYTKVKTPLIRTDLPLLSMEQLEEVFLDKQNLFIQHSIATRAKVLIAFITLTQQLQELEKQKNEAVSTLITLENYQKESPEDDRLFEAVEDAKACLDEIKVTEAALKKKHVLFENLNQQMDQLLQNQDHQWEQFRDTWSSNMIEALEKIGVQLTELEKTEIKRHKSTAELIQRMRELGLSLPKSIAKILPESLKG